VSALAGAGNRERTALAISLVVTGLLYALPFGRLLAWPLVLLSTLAHELGHGLAAALLGATFHSLRIHSDASGVALWSGDVGRFGTAAVAGAGLVGPAAAAFLLLVLGRDERRARLVLGLVGAVLALVTILFVRNAFGVGFTATLAALLLLAAVRAPRLSHTVLLLLAVQLALSVFSRSDYLFSRVALTTAGRMRSDVAVMADALFLPYWFWGAVCGAVSIGLLFLGVRIFFRRA
jgi:hypothetical protein